jgi:HEPN domain-containing protein
MRPTTLEWISKAEDDWHVAQMSYRARKHPSYDATVFHAQQCAEKYLKARLEEAGIAFSRTHDLLWFCINWFCLSSRAGRFCNPF